mmetsp:Transcript_2857/g.3187  ORF Transcript_2857/g.3187 Transcript_2857/m.3187 type:complete len:148 (+) Transcript_2857:72-515(+)
MVEAEVIRAYSDCNEFSSEPRQLRFLASKPVLRDEAIRILKKAVPGYNDFHPELLKVVPEDTQVLIGRLGSVNMYFLGEISENISKKLKADNAFVVNDAYLNLMIDQEERMKDVPYMVKEWQPGPMTHFNRLKKITENHVVFSAWWD